MTVILSQQAWLRVTETSLTGPLKVRLLGFNFYKDFTSVSGQEYQNENDFIGGNSY